MRRHAIVAAVAAGSFVVAAFGHSFGPDPRLTGAPGDAPQACTLCHSGTLNAGKGSVKIAFPANTYTPGAKHHVVVQVSDPDQRRWGFELTARLNSNPSNGQAGDLTPSDANTQVVCETAGAAPCPADKPVEFIMHTSAGTRNGTAGGVNFEFDWTAPGEDAGKVTFYVAANAANGNGAPTGDNIYTSSLEVAPGQAAAPGQLQVPTTRYTRRNLVSDVAGVADQTDPNLVNPWGIALNPSGPFWLSNNHSGTSTLYNGAGDLFPAGNPLVVRVPAAGGRAASAPTGQVYNPTPGFEIAAGKPALFLFATEDGTIAGWNTDVDAANAVTMVDNSGAGAVYKGLALGANNSSPALYAANFNAGTIDVFDFAFKPLSTSGGFQDPNLPAGFAPFNIQRIGRRLYVTYAKQDGAKRHDVAGAGNGFLNVFDMDGNLRQRLVSGGVLNSPWGMAVAPAFFGDYSGTLLVGNFGDGRINAFDMASGEALGALADQDGNAISIEGLWALAFGNGRNGGDANTLYFTAGIANGGSLEDHGLFGSVQPAP